MSGQYQIKASCVEIYNETFNDLLKKGTIATLNEKQQINIESFEQFRSFVVKISKQRKQLAIIGNPASSRSHVVIELEISNVTNAANRTIRITFIDIAGCEPHNFECQEKRNEMSNIHKSINSFRTVIESLNRKEPSPDFRSSKLTHILKPTLTSKNTKILLLTHISQKIEQFSSSKNSLSLARSASEIKCVGKQ